jgi:hypothetical protein
MEAISAGVRTFQEQYVTLSALDSDEPDEYSARRLRCEIARAAWENTRHRNIHPWAQAVRNRYSLYKYIRSIHDVTFQDTEFWVSMIWRGLLRQDLMAGAVPLSVDEGTDEDAARRAAFQLLTASNWNVNKSIASRLGALCGYVGLSVINDAARRQVRVEIAPPESIEDITIVNGNVKSVTLSNWRDDERDMNTKYTLKIYRGEGDAVIYETYVNDAPEAWLNSYDANGTHVWTWQENYGFVPFALIKHIDSGMSPWGVAELQSALSKILETDDVGSMLDDQLRKMVNPIGLFAGMTKQDVEMNSKPATADRPQPGREEMKNVYASNPAATWTPLVFNLDIAQARERIKDIVSAMKDEYPELRNLYDMGGDSSGKALAIIREPVEAKVIDRRVNYDAGLLSALRMGIAIGGEFGYPGYEGFDLRSYSTGELGINIAPRDVFPPTRADVLAEQQIFWQGWAGVANTEVTFETYARSMGWSDEQIEAHYESVQKSYIPAEGM